MKELINIQSELKAPKDKNNTFGGYRYRSLEGILEAVKPLLIANNCYLICNDEMVQLGDRFYVKATATLYNGEGASISATAWAREALAIKGMDEAKITGAASSYARKYALNALFSIDDTKDPDTDEHYKRTHADEASDVPKQKSQSSARKRVTSSMLDDLITSESLLGWVFKRYEDAGYPEDFDAVGLLRKNYEADERVCNRFGALWASYRTAKMTPKMK